MNNATQQSLTILETLTTNGMLPPAQAAVIKAALRGEEAEFFVKKLAEISAVFDAMPKPYETNGQIRPAQSVQKAQSPLREQLLQDGRERGELADLYDRVQAQRTGTERTKRACRG